MVTRNAAIFADWNLSGSEVAQLAARMGANFIEGHAVDHGIVHGADSVTVTNVGKHGSDHPALLFTLTFGRDVVRTLWWNVYVGQKPADVGASLGWLADQYQPHVIALCEAYHCRKVLSGIAGYHRFQGLFGEAKEIAVLVRRDIRVLRMGWLRMKTRWIGPKHRRPHGPRRYARLRLELRSGLRFRVLAVHMPTGGYHGPNSAAVQESADAIVRWGKTTKHWTENRWPARRVA